MGLDLLKKRIGNELDNYSNKLFGWRQHRGRARFTKDCILVETTVGSISLIVNNEISLMENNCTIKEDSKNNYFKSQWSGSMKNRKHISITNSEYGRTLDRIHAEILKHIRSRQNSFERSGPIRSRQNSFERSGPIRSRQNSFERKIDDSFLRKEINQIKNDFKAKISNTCPEYSVLLATKIFYPQEYYSVLQRFKLQQRTVDEQLDIIGARHVSGLLGQMSNAEENGDFYTIETEGLPKLEGKYNAFAVEKSKKIINSNNVKKIEGTLPKNSLYLVRSGGGGAGHFFCMYISDQDLFKIDVMGGDDLCCQPLMKLGEINDDFAEKFRFTGSTSFYNIKGMDEINFFVNVITDKEYRDELS